MECLSLPVSLSIREEREEDDRACVLPYTDTLKTRPFPLISETHFLYAYCSLFHFSKVQVSTRSTMRFDKMKVQNKISRQVIEFDENVVYTLDS